MKPTARHLRTPEERVGMLPNASLPPPQIEGGEEGLLVRALRWRDEEAFGRVLDAYFPAMLRVALSHVDGRAAAEDVVQETWLAALAGIDGFEGRSSVRTWLFGILRNIARTRGRRESRMRPFGELASGTDGAAADPLDTVVDGRTAAAGYGLAGLWARSEDPERGVLARELEERIEAALSVLPPRQREVIVLRDVEGWSSAEVCNALGLSETNQRVLLHRARNRVREELKAYLTDEEPCGSGP